MNLKLAALLLMARIKAKKMLEEENKNLKEQEYIEKLRKENTKLKESLSLEVKERKEKKINGKPSEFLYYVLESIKLEEKDNKEKDSKVEAALRNFNNKIIIHWKDGSQTIRHIKKNKIVFLGSVNKILEKPYERTNEI